MNKKVIVIIILLILFGGFFILRSVLTPAPPAPPSVALPANFPSDVPVYQGRIIKADVTPVEPEREGELAYTKYSATIETSDSVQTISSFYRKEMANQKWVIISLNETLTQFSAEANKGQRILKISVEKPKGKDNFEITIKALNPVK